MATYEVSYTTTEKPEPSSLPATAKIEKLSALPATVDVVGGGLRVRVRNAYNGKRVAAELAFVAVPRAADRAPRTVGLTEDVCRELAEALVAAADEAKAKREAGDHGITSMIREAVAEHRARPKPDPFGFRRSDW